MTLPNLGGSGRHPQRPPARLPPVLRAQTTPVAADDGSTLPDWEGNLEHRFGLISRVFWRAYLLNYNKVVWGGAKPPNMDIEVRHPNWLTYTCDPRNSDSRELTRSSVSHAQGPIFGRFGTPLVTMGRAAK